MSDLEKRLEVIEARYAISELRSRYCWYTVRGMRDELLTLFTDDGVFENARNEGEAPARAHGRAELATYFARLKPARRVPLVTNEVTRVQGDSAEGTCAMLGAGDDSFAGHYIEQFRRVDGTWLFSSRRFFPYWPLYRPEDTRLHP
jgi:ketosteroid isomerase-like protein